MRARQNVHQMSINWFKYAAPQRFYPLAGRAVPWFGAAAALLGLAGLAIGLLIAPTDHQQPAGEEPAKFPVHATPTGT